MFGGLTRKYSRLTVGTRKSFDPQFKRNVKQTGTTETANAFKDFVVSVSVTMLTVIRCLTPLR